MKNKINRQVKGQTVDNQTRCVHYHSDLDIIAIKFRCCNGYYPCFTCHEAEAGHPSQVWRKSEFDTMAILCGVCKQGLTIKRYMESKATCPNCQAAFNPSCQNHYHLYFNTGG
jgi:uncharacterized CHY-type Zn-finger protein